MKIDDFRKKIKRKYTSGTPGHVLDAEYFYYDTEPENPENLAIVCGGYEKCAPDFSLIRSSYPYFFVIYTIKGEGTLQFDSNTYQIRPGTLTGFPPGTAHIYNSNPDKPMEHIFVTFLGRQCKELFLKSSLAEKHILEVRDPDETLQYFQKVLYVGLNKSEYSQEICRALLKVILLEQASYVSENKSHYSISMTSYLNCKKYIDSNFSSVKSPSEVASKCGIDVRYMSALFKKHCHIPPSQYLMRLKLNKAANLLLGTDLSIKEVAFQVGFEDQYHFSKNFKKFHGRSPLNYRNEHL